MPGIRYHPRQIHQTQRHRNGGQKAQNIVFFTQQAGKRTGDDIAVGIVQKVEIGIQWFIQEVNRQGRAKQKSQHLRGTAGAGAVASHHKQNRVEHQQGMDADRVQIDERPPGGHVQPAGAEQSQRRTGDAKGIEFLLAPVLIGEGIVQTDEHIDAAQMERQIAPVPLTGQSHAQQQGSFIGQQGNGNAHEDAPPGRGRAAAVPQGHPHNEHQREGKLDQMDFTVQRVTPEVRAKLRMGDIVGFPEVVHVFFHPFRANDTANCAKQKEICRKKRPNRCICAKSVVF